MGALKKENPAKEGRHVRTKEESFFWDVFRPQSAFYERIKADARATGLSMKAVANIWLADAWAMRSPATEELVAVMKGRPKGGWFSSVSLARMRAKERSLVAENEWLTRENERLTRENEVLKREGELLKIREDESVFNGGVFISDGLEEKEG